MILIGLWATEDEHDVLSSKWRGFLKVSRVPVILRGIVLVIGVITVAGVAAASVAPTTSAVGAMPTTTATMTAASPPATVALTRL